MATIESLPRASCSVAICALSLVFLASAQGEMPSLYLGANVTDITPKAGFRMALSSGLLLCLGTVNAQEHSGHLHLAPHDLGHSDYHPTFLKLFSFDHRKLTCKHNGRELTLRDGQSGKIVDGILE